MPPEGSVARQSWYATLEAVERLNVLWRAYGDLLWNGIIPITGHVTVPFEDFVWEHPERLPRPAATDIRYMLDAISAGAGPTIRSQSELEPVVTPNTGTADTRSVAQIADDLAYATNMAAGAR
jgi:hypothetical protein